MQGCSRDFKTGGARPLFSKKKVAGPEPGFTLFPPKSGGARAQPAHTATPALTPDIYIHLIDIWP